jgi:hypothetical protein
MLENEQTYSRYDNANVLTRFYSTLGCQLTVTHIHVLDGSTTCLFLFFIRKARGKSMRRAVISDFVICYVTMHRWWQIEARPPCPRPCVEVSEQS